MRVCWNWIWRTPRCRSRGSRQQKAIRMRSSFPRTRTSSSTTSRTPRIQTPPNRWTSTSGLDRQGSPPATASSLLVASGASATSPHFHHGLFTSLKQAVLAHAGEALDERHAFEQLSSHDQNSLIEFLKSLQMLPPGTKTLVVDERFQPRQWPPAREGQ